ncbi:MAG: hypothetical protein JO122_17325 [Acetobacteraceae bacterium]|nr:hypothetical protein [Acetobacteraceae bacterium]
MHVKLPLRAGALAAAVIVVATVGAAYGEETSNGVTVLRGTPPPAPQQRAQPVAVAQPALPTCPEGYYYAMLAGYCYQLIDPVAGRR